MKTERTPNPMLKTLKAMCKAARKHIGASLYLHVDLDPTAPDYQRDRALFTLSLSTGRYPNQRTEKFEHIPGWIKGGHTSATVERTYEGRTWLDYDEAYAPRGGCWSFTGSDNFANIIELLPSDASVELRVVLDNGTHEYATRNLLHIDVIMMRVTWDNGRKVRDFELDSTTLPHNTARFGTPNHERDTRGRGD